MNGRTISIIALALAAIMVIYIPVACASNDFTGQMGGKRMPMGAKNITVTPMPAKKISPTPKVMPTMTKQAMKVSATPMPTKKMGSTPSAMPTMIKKQIMRTTATPMPGDKAGRANVTARPTSGAKAPLNYTRNATLPGYAGNPMLPDSGNVKYYNATGRPAPVKMPLKM